MVSKFYLTITKYVALGLSGFVHAFCWNLLSLLYLRMPDTSWDYCLNIVFVIGYKESNSQGLRLARYVSIIPSESAGGKGYGEVDLSTIRASEPL